MTHNNVRVEAPLLSVDQSEHDKSGEKLKNKKLPCIDVSPIRNVYYEDFADRWLDMMGVKWRWSGHFRYSVAWEMSAM